MEQHRMEDNIKINIITPIQLNSRNERLNHKLVQVGEALKNTKESLNAKRNRSFDKAKKDEINDRSISSKTLHLKNNNICFN